MRLSVTLPDLLLLAAFLGTVSAAGVVRRRAGLALAVAAAVGWGVYAGWVDTHNDEVQATVLLLLAGGFALGVARAELCWLWGLILGLSIPAASLVGRAPFNRGTLVALIPAFAGALGGGVLRRCLKVAAG